MVIQARLGSTRLPKKLLYEIAGFKLIDHVIHRALQIDPSFKVVIATTTNSEDEELVEYCTEFYPVLITRGSEKDVFGRFEQAISEHVSEENFLVRITSDDPVRDPGLTRTALQTLAGEENAVAIVNRGNYKFPLGVETEICRIENLLQIPNQEKDEHIKEHIFPYYRKMDENLCLSLQPDRQLAGYSLTVDTMDDLRLIDQRMNRASNKFSKSSLHLTWQEVIDAEG